MIRILMVAGAFLVTYFIVYALVGLVRKQALDSGHLDLPNERSSHVSPTPSGGGIAVIGGWALVVAALCVAQLLPVSIVVAIGPPAFLLAITGYVDDRKNLSAVVRLAFQIVAVMWFIFFAGAEWSAHIPGIQLPEALSGLIVGAALIWLINLFNFMDGIDGIAGSEAVFVLSAICIFCVLVGAVPLAILAATLAGACFGFLRWNWSPAKIFLGDVGSASLGFLIGALSLIFVDVSEASLLIPVVLLGVFLADATVTLLGRMISGQVWYSAHRSHAYQHLAIRWSDHGRVTLVASAVNTCWLFPIAVAAFYLPDYVGLFATLALAPLVWAVFALGAGRPNEAQSSDDPDR